MNLLPHAKRVMTASLIAFFAAAALTLMGRIDAHLQHMIQAGSLVTFGISFGTMSTIMRTWMWRQSLVVAACQTAIGIGYLLWFSGAFQ